MSCSISDRLKALGVQVGIQNLRSPTQPTPDDRFNVDLADILGGVWIETPMGKALVVERHYPIGQPYGRAALQLSCSLDNIALLNGDPRLGKLKPEEILFLDTETTGLSGGTGTYAFTIGAGRFIDREFVLHQFFMPDPAYEPAQLYALESFAAPTSALVSFNGKSFDAPLIHTRFTFHGLNSPFADFAHLDLLHLSRKLWRNRLPSRTLLNLENHILGALRAEEDIPGWLIPQVYFDFLQTGNASPLKQVFYHNAMDVVTLVALLDHITFLIKDPVKNGSSFAVDLIALGKLFEDVGDLERAAELYLHGLRHDDTISERTPRLLLLQALQRLASIRKRQNNINAAIQIWSQAASFHDIEAHIELAKCYEHRLKDFNSALHWTETAITDLDSSILHLTQMNTYQRKRLRTNLQHRQSRLSRKLLDQQTYE